MKKSFLTNLLISFSISSCLFITDCFAQNIDLKAVLKHHFGKQIQLDTSISKNFWVEELNGDSFKDLIILVKVNGMKSSLRKNVTVYHTFFGKNTLTEKKAKFPVTLAIIEGRGGTKGFTMNNKVSLIQEVNKIGIQKIRNNWIKTISKNSRKKRLLNKNSCKGGAIKSFTESSASVYLCWNGSKYVWFGSLSSMP